MIRPARSHITRFAIVGVCLVLAAGAASARAADVDFNRDVQPVLADNCLACHGPDANHRKAGLRLDTFDGATAALEAGRRAIVPGDPGASELIVRIDHADPAKRMPHRDSGKTLTDAERELLRRWIAGGAKYAAHWAFIAPKRPELPRVSDERWAMNAIDRFILARLDAEGLAPTEPATKRQLIRRVTLDLTGLPPTAEEVDAFVADDSPDAYERVVDRLLASPRYGERMAWPWLDAARYADTAGYQGDPYRSQWPWRDWVVRALNANMAFDRFTVEQIAGDLLPGATEEQKLATAFNRNHMHNAEGGRISEETRVENVMDRAETTGTVWLGLTFNCCRCHDHKFDPITNAEYFKLYDFFNQTSEAGQINQNDASPISPYVSFLPPERRGRLAELEAKLAELRRRLDAPDAGADAAQAAWEAESVARLADHWQTLDATAHSSTGGATITKRADGALHVTGTLPDKDVYDVTARTDRVGITAIRLEALVDPQSPGKGPGRDEQGNFVLSELEVTARPIGRPDAAPVVVKLAAATADHAQEGFGVERAIDGKVDADNGWAVDGHVIKQPRWAMFYPEAPIGFDGGAELSFRFRFESRHTHHAMALFRLSVTTEPSYGRVTWSPWHLAAVFDPPGNDPGKTFAHEYEPERGVDLGQKYAGGAIGWKRQDGFADGQVNKLRGVTGANYLYRTVASPDARKLTLKLGSDDAIKVWLNGELVHANQVDRAASANSDTAPITLRAGENRLLMKIVNTAGPSGFYFRAEEAPTAALDAEVARALGVPADRRDERARAIVRDFYRRRHAPSFAPIAAALDAAIAERDAAAKTQPTVPVMVMDTVGKPRETFVLAKGQYDKRTEERVTADVPAALPPLPAGVARDRLALANWIVSPANPLTARVTVNGYWQTFFGRGIVKTPDDFGLQGARPSHPELLDWLAVEFVESGWDVKRMHRLIVTSATYRQSSRVTPALLERDPQNVLLARSPRYRMPSWMLRDQALAASGLLVPTMGGEPVKPYQPAGIWAEATFGIKRYTRDAGDALYRRSLYTFWRRIVGPTVFFDEAKRQVCEVKRNLTNTPLHALVTLNDVTYVEAARALAERAIRDGGDTAGSRIAFAFTRLTARPPTADELSLLTDQLAKSRARFAADPAARDKLLAVGESKRDASIDATDHAAMTAVCNVLLNLDETLTRQ